MKKSVGVIGLGKLGSALAQGLQSADFKVVGLAKNPDRANELAQMHQLRVIADGAEFLKECEIILLCVKPTQAQDAIRTLAPGLNPARHLVLSVCAGLTLQQLESYVGGPLPFVRIVTNTPCLVNEGMSGLIAGRNARTEHMDTAVDVFSNLGRAMVIQESQADAMTGIAGCGPAFVFQILEGLMDAGIRVGLPAKQALEMAAQTLYGSALMVLETKKHPAELRQQVTTPGGATIEGVAVLEAAGIRSALIEAVTSATKRASELGRK